MSTTFTGTKSYYIPLNYWLTSEPMKKFQVIDDNEKPGDFKMCDCSEDTVFDLCRTSKQERVDGTANIGMKQIVSLPYSNSDYGQVKDLGPEGKDLVRKCHDFLQLKYEQEKLRNSLEWREYWPKLDVVKTMNINIFIQKVLGIEDGYEYWLMNFLEWNNLMEHGSGIRCGWIKDNVSLTSERKKELLDLL